MEEGAGFGAPYAAVVFQLKPDYAMKQPALKRPFKTVPLALLVKWEKGTPTEVTLTETTWPVELEGLPLRWLGQTSMAQSVAHLMGLFDQSGSVEVKESLVSAIGFHRDSRATDFLIGIVISPGPQALRREAVEGTGLAGQ